MTFTISKLGAERLRDIADLIELEGQRFDYANWLDSPELSSVHPEDRAVLDSAEEAEDFLNKQAMNCGTVGCVAGWAAMEAARQGLIGQLGLEPNDFGDGYKSVVERIGRAYFELDSDDGWAGAWNLFGGGVLRELEGGYDGDEFLAPPHIVAKALRMVADGEHPEWEVES